jgi:hypothetical protein
MLGDTHTTITRLAPACHVIDAFGGPGALARLLGIHRSTVARWETPEDRSGTGGIVPRRRVDKVAELAKTHGITWFTPEYMAGPVREVSAPLRSTAAYIEARKIA